MIKYTLIIPHHNSSNLLNRLLKSVSIKLNMQIIVVDDNSTEKEYKLVQDLQQIYIFELYKNEGKTAGGARNTGIKYAKGQWLILQMQMITSQKTWKNF